LVEIDKSYKGLDLGHIPWGQPVMNAGYFDGIHLHSTFQEDEAKVFSCGPFKHAFLHFEVDTMLLEDGKDHNTTTWCCSLVQLKMRMLSMWIMMAPLAMNSSRCCSLSGTFLDCETEEHNQRFKQASVNLEGCLPLISYLDPYIVVSLTDVKLGEIPHFSFGYFVEDIWDQSQRVGVLHYHHVELQVVLNKMEAPILLFYEEDRRGHWQL